MILSGQSILALRPVVDPQHRTEHVCAVSKARTTYGVGPAGYDLRLESVDGNFLPNGFGYWLSPGEFVLASAAERFDMPSHLLGVVHDKSSWARRGLSVQNTVIEPGWRGFLTLELYNNSGSPIFLPYGAGICQVVFHVLDQPAAEPYDGKYQDQGRGPQVAL